MRKYFYFRAVTDEDDDDANVDSCMVPVENITGLLPTIGLKIFCLTLL